MAATYAAPRAAAYSASTFKPFSIVADNSYPSNGYPVTVANVGLKSYIDQILFGVTIDGSGNALLPVFDFVNQTIRFIYMTGGTDAAPTTVAQPLTKAGAATASAVDATRPNLTPGAGKEVPVGTNLAGFTVYGVAVGI